MPGRPFLFGSVAAIGAASLIICSRPSIMYDKESGKARPFGIGYGETVLTPLVVATLAGLVVYTAELAVGQVL